VVVPNTRVEWKSKPGKMFAEKRKVVLSVNLLVLWPPVKSIPGALSVGGPLENRG
jgi:hypothetical protein